METFYSLLLLLSILFCVAPIISQTVSGSGSVVTLPQGSSTIDQCDCYLVSGPDPGYFQHYQFWDFRKSPLPRLFSQTDHGAKDGTETIHDSVFGSNTAPLANSSFAGDWKIQNWERLSSAQKPIPIMNSVENIFFAKDPPGVMGSTGNTYLVLRTMRLQDHTSAAELESRMKNVFHSSLRVRLRLLPYGNLIKQSSEELTSASNQTKTSNQTMRNPGGPPKGACAGIFMYHSSDCETDIEILTSDPPNIVHYANQPDYDPVTDTAIPGASVVAAIPTPWTEWATHRIDWLSGLSVWYVDDHLLSTKTYGVPNLPSTPVINLWSDGGEWTGDMQVGESVFMGIEWIQLVYNVSDVPAPALQSEDTPELMMRDVDVAFDDEDEDEDGSLDETDVADERKKKKQKGKGRGEQKDKACHKPCWIDNAPRP